MKNMYMDIRFLHYDSCLKIDETKPKTKILSLMGTILTILFLRHELYGLDFFRSCYELILTFLFSKLHLIHTT